MSALRKLAAFILMAVMFLPAISSPIAGDGMAMTHSSVYDKWGLVAEETQFGVISHSNGVERLIIAIKIDASSLGSQDAFAWMFPVPGDPSNVDIGIVRSVPQLAGEDLGEQAKNALVEGIMVVSGTQVYPLMVTLPAFFIGSRQSYGPSYLLPEGDSLGGRDSVDVFEEVSMYGVTTELVGANDSAALAGYFADYGLELPSQVQPAFDEYVGGDYSFVLSRITDIAAFRGNASLDWYNNLYTLGVYVSFPTDELYYPMKLTSSYGSRTVPILLQVMGYVSVQDDLGYDFEMRRFTSDAEIFDAELAPFFGARTPYGDALYLRDLKYTEIKIEAQAESFTSDIWMTEGQPAQAEFAEFVIANNWLIALLIFITASMASSLLSAIWIFHGQGPMKAKFALLGLSNFLTLIGFILISAKLRVHETLVLQKDEKPDSRPLTSFVAAFSVLFIFMVFASYALIVTVAQ